MRTFIYLIGGVSALLHGYCADARTTRDQAVLNCGGSTFELDTQWAPSSSGHISWLAQTLQVNGRLAKTEAVGRSIVQGRQTLPATITGWQCIAGTRQKIVVLSYSCADDDGTGCDGHREWLRLLDAKGVSLDADLRREDPRQDALFDRLGIGTQIDQGIQMQSAIHTN